ncbi:3-hydroxyisobutyryl-CoA hydrolase-like protein 1, mitochondrial isoform X2 [Populus trichocarpa]|uniref:3-hydroxyisobutyryl-CoA hydrolase-like protein 1, mitochondrial isoform X2 n=1 Tax=Populus trichocarpa TaxID=3694 RepID=UPI00227933E5|nr:3-hydroxyisobutyryl-CoA hydrolase-like protein 1, mitochondrial isoform X2 [Populus trichocarpa]
MQGLKSAAALLIRSCCNNNKSKLSHSFLTHCPQHSRSLSSSPPTEDDLDNQVLVEDKANSRSAILNRPSALNALNTNMGARLLKLYKAWEKDSSVGFVTLKGSGRAFSAGGDIVNLYHLINQGKWEACREFFGTLYTFIYVLGTYLKPHVFATPETLIGFHPDAGASFFLSHLPGHLGEYLALTGGTLNGAEMIACGLATHYTNSEKLHLVEHHLGKLVTDDPSVIETSLEQYGDLVYPDKMSVLHRIEMVDKCFSHDTVEEIFDALEREAAETNDAWFNSTLRRLKEASPLSLKVSLRSIQEGRFQTLDQCLVREYRMSLQGISKQISGDFCEGVRARMVDKDLAPKWNPPSLEQVSEDMVDRYFSPLSESEPDLDLPTKQREAFT